MKCSKCGHEISKDASFCNQCGEPVSNIDTGSYEEIETKSKEDTINESKKHWNDKYIILILILIFAIAVGGGLIYKNIKSNDKVEEASYSGDSFKEESVSNEESEVIEENSSTEETIGEKQNINFAKEDVDEDVLTAWVEGAVGQGEGQEELENENLYLKIWDAFRPTYAQFILWEICPDATYVANPNNGFSSHSRGNTVDVTLVDKEGKEVVMPTQFDDFSSLADRDYSDCTEVAKLNAEKLEQLMVDKGFKAYYGEWWHFTDADEYTVEKKFLSMDDKQ